MKNVNFIQAMINVDGYVDLLQYGMGTVTLELEGRSYILDIVSSVSEHVGGVTIIGCSLAIDKDECDSSKYDLTEVDLFDSNLKATIFIGDEYEDEPEHMTLFVKIGDMTKAIDLTNELNC